MKKPFIRKYIDALNKEGKSNPQIIERWLLKHPMWGVIITCLAIAFGLMALSSMIYPPPPTPIPPSMTIYGFVGWVQNVQITAIGWVAIFALLWMTKW